MLRTISLILGVLIACVALSSSPASAARQFPETGYSITDDRILDYFDHRGGTRVFGFPISREFDFMGTRVQFFQRAVLQVQPDGGVALLNLLSQDLLPYTHINGSVFPAESPTLVAGSPSPGDPDYATKALDFVRANAPDDWEGMKTNFFSAFQNTVTYQEAFPKGDADQGLLPLINLEIWGLPTSRPTYDPSNGNFVYLRFQRGIMHFDKTSGLTQGLLLGDYLKSVITGRNLPPDLDGEASGSKLYRQYDNNRVGGLARAADLPGTNLFAAFEKDGVMVPTPAPQPTAIPIPPTATPVPAAQPPANIQVTGEAKFVEHVNGALNLLATKSPYNYSIVKQNVFRIDQDPTGPYAAPATDLAGHSLKIPEWTAFPSEWNDDPDSQREWLAGLLVHNAVHIAQHARGVPPYSSDSEMEALIRQQDALSAVETTTDPSNQFWNYVQTAVENNTGWFGEWRQPQSPGWVKPTATPSP